MLADRFEHAARWFLFTLVASTLIGAALGIIVILAGNWSWFEIRVLLTAGVIALASICGLACGASMSRVRWQWLPSLGIGLTILSAVAVIGGMWSDIASADYWKFTAVASVFAVAIAHVALLSIAHLAARYRWAQAIAYGAIFAVALVVSGMVLSSSVDEGTFRLLAVLALIDAAFTILVPIFHLLSRRELASATPADSAAIDEEIARLTARIEELRQAQRSAAARVTIEPTANSAHEAAN